MSYANPTIPTIDSAIGLDRVIQELQEDLSTLPWLQVAFGRAWKFGAEWKAYDGAGEYIDMAVNDNLDSHSWFTADREEETVDYLQGELGITLERRLNVHFTVNLQRVDENKDYIFTEVLKKDVLKVLKASPWVRVINSYDDRQELMYPFAQMVFNVTVNYMEEC